MSDEGLDEVKLTSHSGLADTVAEHCIVEGQFSLPTCSKPGWRKTAPLRVAEIIQVRVIFSILSGGFAKLIY